MGHFNRKVILVSGGFDPMHSGHVALLREADAYGKVIVALNSDAWLTRKKGKPFMKFEERATILLATQFVYDVVAVEDKDGTVVKALRSVQPTFFANGGDRTAENTPELEYCKQVGIIPLFGIGGLKTQSSSELLNAFHKG